MGNGGTSDRAPDEMNHSWSTEDLNGIPAAWDYSDNWREGKIIVRLV
jgi:hypothetical protein